MKIKVDKLCQAGMLFPGSHHLSLNFVWELLACVAMIKNWLQPIFIATEWVNLKTMGEVIGRLYLINYSLGTNSTVKPLKLLGVAKPTIYKVLQSLENWRETENNLQANGLQWISPRGRGSSLSMRQWTMVESTWQKMPQNWEFTRFCSESV